MLTPGRDRGHLSGNRRRDARRLAGAEAALRSAGSGSSSGSSRGRSPTTTPRTRSSSGRGSASLRWSVPAGRWSPLPCSGRRAPEGRCRSSSCATAIAWLLGEWDSLGGRVVVAVHDRAAARRDVCAVGLVGDARLPVRSPDRPARPAHGRCRVRGGPGRDRNRPEPVLRSRSLGVRIVRDEPACRR